MSSVVFYERNYAQKVALPIPVTVDRYSWNMIGGPDKAYLTAASHADKWDLLKLLRCPVEVYSGDGKLTWWGYVNKVTIPHGEQRIGLGLDMLANYVVWEYGSTSTATTVASDGVSIAEYGQKEYRSFDTGATLAEAQRARDLYLADHKYAQPEVEFSGGSDEVQIECYGWYASLSWKYYSNAGTSDSENTTQISSIVTSAGQFLNGTIVEHIAGITSSVGRDGKRSGEDYVTELLNAGTTDVRPLLAYVDSKRYLHVYERTAEPSGSADYLLLPDGSLVTSLNQFVEPEWCANAAWVMVKDVPISARSTVAMRPFFIESSEYNAAQDRTTYRPMGGYEQTRLSKYIKEESNPPGPTEYPPVYIPSSTDGGGAVSSWVIYGYDNGATPYLTDEHGLTFNDLTGVDYIYTVEFTAPSNGLYLIGAAGTSHTGGTAHGVFLTISTDVVGDQPQGASSPVSTTAQSTSLTMSYDLTLGDVVTIYVDETADTWPADTKIFVIKLA